MGATKGLTTAIGELLSDIIEPIARTQEDSTEAQSTEELLSKIKEANVRLQSPEMLQKEVMVGSMDVTALYPSIDQVSSAKIVREEYLRSDIEVENIDWRAASLYLALTVDRQELVREGIAHIVPRRKDGRGRKPTVKSPKMSGPLTREERLDVNKTELEDIEWEAETNIQRCVFSRMPECV